MEGEFRALGSGGRSDPHCVVDRIEVGVMPPVLPSPPGLPGAA